MKGGVIAIDGPSASGKSSTARAVLDFPEADGPSMAMTPPFMRASPPRPAEVSPESPES